MASSGIAAVTAAIQQLLADALARAWPDDPVEVHTGAPSGLPSAPGRPMLDFYLYRLEINRDVRNVPERIPDLGTIEAPALPLDLHFLLSAVADDVGQAQSVLECAALQLHDHPLIARPAEAGDWSRGQVVIVPVAMAATDMASLWLALQAPLRPSLAYRVTTTLSSSRGDVSRPAPVTDGPLL